MYFTSFENASLRRLGLIQHPKTGVFSHRKIPVTVVCIPTGFVDNKVITQFACTIDEVEYNFDNFSNLFAHVQTVLETYEETK
jgi:hypothetical protein